MRAADMKKARPNRLGDLIRTVWRVPEKTRARCLRCDWTPTEGIAYANVARDCREHTRVKGHPTRFASVEVVEYRVSGNAAVSKPNWGQPRKHKGS